MRVRTKPCASLSPSPRRRPGQFSPKFVLPSGLQANQGTARVTGDDDTIETVGGQQRVVGLRKIKEIDPYVSKLGGRSGVSVRGRRTGACNAGRCRQAHQMQSNVSTMRVAADAGLFVSCQMLTPNQFARARDFSIVPAV